MVIIAVTRLHYILRLVNCQAVLTDMQHIHY